MKLQAKIAQLESEKANRVCQSKPPLSTPNSQRCPSIEPPHHCVHHHLALFLNHRPIQVPAKPIKIATGKSAKSFLAKAQQANGKLENKLNKLEGALTSIGGKVLAKRDSSLEARIDALAAQVTRPLARSPLFAC
jgi:hypothetical protein